MSKSLRASEVKSIDNSRIHYLQTERGSINVKKKYAVYFRVSGSSQSLALQIESAKKWAEANGISWGKSGDF